MSAKLLQKSYDFLRLSLNDELLQEELSYFESLKIQNLVELFEDEKKVFWLNMYNALVQRELKAMDTFKVEKSIFSKKKHIFAGEKLSLDDIEHGILRGNFWKYGLGFLPGRYLSKQTQYWKCKKLDPRIHFQLNCGAASCPMIRLLTLNSIEDELDIGEEDFILGESRIESDKERLLVSGLFLFYLKDFGGMKGIRRLIRKYYPENEYKISFLPFDWTKSPKKTN
jgi:hypothetical protein